MVLCPKCGTELNEGSQVCPSCGSPVGTTSQRPSGQANDNPKYKNLGGWLLFFVVCWGLTALAGLAGLARCASVISHLVKFDLFDNIPAVVGIIISILTSMALSVTMCVCISRRSPNFLRLYQILGIADLAVALIATIPLTRGVSSAVTAMAGTTIYGCMGAAAGLVLMTMYFCKSERVRTYMKSTEYLDKALFRIGA